VDLIHMYNPLIYLVFGPLPSNAECIARMPTRIGNHGDHAFQVLMYEIMLPSRLVSKVCSHFCTRTTGQMLLKESRIDFQRK